MTDRPPLNTALVRKIVAEQFPRVQPREVRLLGVQGADHDAYDIDDRWIVRFPKVAAQVARVEIEHRIVRLIADRLPIAVPRFELVGRPSEEFPFVFTGYEKLAGTPWDVVKPWPMRSDALAEQLGAFLTALHAVPTPEVEHAGVRPDVETTMVKRLKKLEAQWPLIEPRLPSYLRRDVAEFIARGVIADEYTGPLVLVHNDLLAEHVLVDPQQQRATGVIDWGDVALGDPAIDFAAIFCWSGGFCWEVLPHYGGAGDLHRIMSRAAFIGTCLALGDVAEAGESGRYTLDRALHHVHMAFGGLEP